MADPLVVGTPPPLPFIAATEKKKKKSYGAFSAMGLRPEVLKAIAKKGYRQPTPIQRKVIPLILSGSDVMAMARTGSGKTLAFVVPLIHKLHKHNSESAGIRGLIISPTRDLCAQTYKYVRALACETDLRVALITGGDSIEHHFDQLSTNPDIVIATPGRLLHILHETGLSLKALEMFILDEADRLFEEGLQDELQAIIKEMPSKRQTLLFSATLPKMVVEFSRAGLRNPEVVRLDADSQLSEQLYLAYFNVRSYEKPAALLLLIMHVLKPDEQAIVFVATKHHVEYLHELLTSCSIPTAMIFGKMDNTARKIELNRFKKKKCRFLIVTDIAARGIDIPQLDAVINYDFPTKPKLFVHRVGRTARAGRSGAAYSFVQPDELPYLMDLKNFLATTNVQPVLNGKPNGVHGRMPARELATETESVLRTHKSNPMLDHYERSMKNAIKLYRQTRGSASPAAVAAAKQLLSGDANFDTDGDNIAIKLDVHPLFAHLLDEAESAAEKFKEQLKNFRPAQTVFEVLNKHSNVMIAKREQHNSIVDKVKSQRAIKNTLLSYSSASMESADSDVELSNDEMDVGEDETSTNIKKRAASEAFGESSGNNIPPSKKPKMSFRDEQFYMDHVAKGHHTEEALSISNKQPKTIEEMMLDIDPDDDRSIFRKRSLQKWDAKKKKYIQADSVPDKKKLFIKNEAGQKVILGDKEKTKDKRNKGKGKGKAAPETKQVGKLYMNWMKKTHRQIPKAGESEDPSKAASPEEAAPRAALPWRYTKPAEPKATNAPNPAENKSKKKKKKKKK